MTSVLDRIPGDRQTLLAGGLVLGGGATAIAAAPVANRIFRHEYGAFRDLIDATPNLTATQLAERMAQFDRSTGMPIVTGRNIAIGLGITAAIGGVVLLGTTLLGGD